MRREGVGDGGPGHQDKPFTLENGEKRVSILDLAAGEYFLYRESARGRSREARDGMTAC